MSIRPTQTATPAPPLMGGGAMGRRVRETDWSATPLGDYAGWAQSLRSALSLVLNTKGIAALYWGPEQRLLYNDAYAQALGDRHPAAFGRPMAEVLPDLAPVLGPQVAEALRSGTGFAVDDVPLTMFREGRDPQTWWSYSFSPVQGEGGDFAGVVLLAAETTDQKRAERQLAGEEERWRSLLQQMPGFAAVLSGPDHRYTYVNDAYREISGERDFIGRTVRDVFPELVDQGFYELLDSAYATGTPFAARAIPISLARHDGERFIDLLYHPVRDEGGRITGIFVGGYDVTERMRSEQRLRDSELRYRQIVEGSEDFAIVTLDAHGVITGWNAGATRITGRADSDALGQPGAIIFTPEDRVAGVPDHEMNRAQVDGRALNERWHMRQDGTRFWGSGLTMRLDQDGGGYLKIFRDRTAEHNAEARRAVFADLSDALRDLDDPDDIAFAAAQILGRRLDVSRVGYAAIDHDNETLHVDRDWTAPGVETLAGVLTLRDYGSFIESLKRGEFTVIGDIRQDPRTADPVHVSALESKNVRSFVNAPIVEQGRLAAVFFIDDARVRDWSEDDLSLIRAFADRTRTAVERAQGAQALRLSQERYRTLFESIESGFCIVEVDLDAAGGRADYRVVEANPAFYRQTGFPASISGAWLRRAVPDLEEAWYEIYSRVARTGEPTRFEQGSDAIGRWFDVYAFRVGEAGERRVAILFNDISARRKAEERLREINETLEELVAARAAERDRLWNLSQDMLARADFTGMMSAVSPAWTQVLGWTETELLSRGYASFMHPDDMPPTLAAIARMAQTRQPTRFENRIATRGGGWKPIEWTVAPEPDGVNFIAVGRDLSEAKAREAELQAVQETLRQSQKMEAMGSLTGGVAHDFNNLLAPIVGSLDMLQRKGLGGEREQRLIAGAIQSAERARTLVQRLLAFARRQPLQAVALDVGGLIANMADLVASTTGPQIRVAVEIAPDLPPALGDQNQLEMALLNLAVNSRDAMPDGGTLRISAAKRAVGGDHAAGLTPGDYVCLSVADTGKGMDEDTLRRAIEPFFSTKGIGKGTGLGLSMVHGLASQLGGTLTIESHAGVGTNVELWLPVSEAAIDTPELPMGQEAERSRAGTVLLVDDEDLVRISTADMLSDLGYDVVGADSAEQALALVRNGLRPDLLVTDHLMPGMTGTDLARHLRAGLPGLQILVVSGYAEAEGIAPDLPRLTKPFRSDELAAALSPPDPPRSGPAAR